MISLTLTETHGVEITMFTLHLKKWRCKVNDHVLTNTDGE